MDLLIARGVEPVGARRIVERFGAGTASTVSRLLAWREKMGRTYDSSVTAWATWFTGRFAEGKLEFLVGFTNQASPKVHLSDLGVRPAPRVVIDPEAAEKLRAEREALGAWNAIGGFRRLWQRF